MPEQDIVWRPVGFREVFRLLDLDRYDDIILEHLNLKRTGERPKEGSIEVFQSRKSGRHAEPYIQKAELKDRIPAPLTDKREDAGRSIGVMTVGTAKRKFL
jgi:hypothetical protein